jgi:hypothetical protein
MPQESQRLMRNTRHERVGVAEIDIREFHHPTSSFGTLSTSYLI